MRTPAQWWRDRQRQRFQAELRSNLQTPPEWLVQMFGGREAVSGARVTESSAMSWTALASGIRFIAETMASMPLQLMRRLEPRGREPAVENPLYWVLHNQPNPEMTSFEWRELSVTHQLLWGNSYSQIVWDQTMRPVELWPLNPDRVQVKRDASGKIVYWVSLPADDLGSQSNQDRRFVVINAEDMLHIRGFSRYGFIGEKIAQVHRETIGLGLATEQFAAQLFGQGLNAGGILSHPGELSKEAGDRLLQRLNQQAGGLSKAHRTIILEEGMQWTQTTIEPEKAQFLQSRVFLIREAARILRIPPHLLYDLERATFANIEHQSIEVVVYTLLAWVRRWEQRLDMQLISQKSSKTLFTRFALEALLRGDMASRYAAYATGKQNGWLSVNDIRELEDMNPVPKGNEYLEPVNMRPLGSATATPPAPDQTGDQPSEVTGGMNQRRAA